MKKQSKVLVTTAMGFLISLLLYDQNTRLSISKYTVMHKCIPKCFDGFLVAHISDIHNFNSRRLRNKLLSELEKASPDIIIISGDLFDYGKGGGDNTVALCKNLSEISDCYAVSGNHDRVPDLKESLLDTGIMLLDNMTIYIERCGKYISLSGISDTNDSYLLNARLRNEINNLKLGVDFAMLLAHRPEYFEVYSDYGFDLVFTGHAHGGQIRLPFVGGLFAPNQGVLPKYTSGLYSYDKCIMSVSRGLGNSVFPLRINNRPELTFVTLYS